MAFTLFFFSQETIHQLFLKRKPFYGKAEVIVPKYANLFKSLILVYFTTQIALPVRHHFIKGDVFWTEEGHRLSWRMMLRTKNGFANYKVVDQETGEIENIRLKDYLSEKQIRSATTKPDVIWQFAQKLKTIYLARGKKVSVFADCKVSLNGNHIKPLVDPNVDLANVPWEPLKHSNWILPEN